MRFHRTVVQGVWFHQCIDALEIHRDDPQQNNFLQLLIPILARRKPHILAAAAFAAMAEAIIRHDVIRYSLVPTMCRLSG